MYGHSLFGPSLGAGPEAVDPIQNAFVDSLGHFGLRGRFVVHREVVEDVLSIGVHASDAVAHDHGEFVGEGRVVAHEVGHRVRYHVGVAVLMLRPFARKRRSTSRSPHQETATHRIRGRPDQVPHPLEAEHRIEDVEGDGGNPEVRIGRPGGQEGGDGSGLADPFFEDDPFFALHVGRRRVGIDRPVALAFG